MAEFDLTTEPNRKPRIRVPARSDRTSKSVVDYERARGRLTQDTFQNYSLNLGLGTNNALSDSTYGFLPITRDRTLLEWIYRGSWIAGVAIDAVAEDMTREGIKITSQMDPGMMRDLDAGANHYGVWSGTNDTIAWGRLYGGSLGVIMIDGQDPRTPLRLDRIGRNQFQGIMSFDRWMVEPDLERMVRGPGDDSLVPASYWVVASGSGVSFEGMRVHHSRCFRHEGVRLPYWQRVMENMWGISILERLYDRLIAFDSATNGAAQLVYKSYLRTFAVDGLREMVAAGGAQLNNLERYVEFMRRYQGIEGITLIDKNDTFEGQGSAGTAFGGIADALVQFGQQISGALQIPLTRLFGQAPAGLNATGESDMRNYYDGIHQRQERDLRRPIDKIYRVMARSMGIDLPSDFDFVFPPLWQMQEQEKAATATQVVTAVSAAQEAGLVSQKVAMKELKQSSDLTGIFSNISDADIESADDQIQPPMPEGMPGMEDIQGMGGEPGQEMGQQSEMGNEEDQGTAGLLGNAVPLAAGGGDPQELGLGSNPRNESSAGGGPGGLGSPRNTTVPPSERARALRIFQRADARMWSLRPRDQKHRNFDANAMREFRDLPIYIETHKGEHRRPEWPVLTADYGYIRMTGSAEGLGEGLDCFVGDDENSDCVVVLDQLDPETGQFDEHKVFLGFRNRREALDCYGSSYTDAASRIGSVKTMSFGDFCKLLEQQWRGKAA